MKKIRMIYFAFLLLFLGCDNENDPFNRSEPYSLITVDIGEVRDLDFFNDTLYVGTETEGIHIFKLGYYNDDNLEFPIDAVQLNEETFITSLYENLDWGIGKDIREIYYDSNTNVLHALDRFGYMYHAYIPHLLNDINSCFENPVPGCLDCTINPFSTLNDTLIINDCAPVLQTHATQFVKNSTDGIHVLFKHNKNNELYLNESYSIIKNMNYILPPQMTTFLSCELIGLCSDNSISISDSLNYGVNDIFYNDSKIYVANPNKDANSFAVYQSEGEMIDSYNTESEVRSIFASNDYILAGTNNGCYITLLEENGISDSDDSKLKIAENFTVYDIYFDSINNKLILSTGSDGVLVYNWDGNSFNIYEEMRLYSSYAFTARIINDVYYVATKNGLEIYNIGD